MTRTGAPIGERSRFANARLGEIVFINLFFFFFSFQIFSPQVGGVTLYLEYVVLALNPYFYAWLVKKRVTLRVAAGFLILLAYTALQPLEGIKFATVIAGTLALIYSFERGMFYAPFYLGVSTLFAAVQFGLVVAGDPLLAAQFGPSNIASLVWGSYATQTYTNFFTVFWFPRVSGLSREAGFFASYVLTMFLAVIVNHSISRQRLRARSTLTYAVAGVLSLSKSTLAFGIALPFLRFRRYIDRLPMPAVAAAFMLTLVFAVNYATPFLLAPGNGSILGRVAGYALIDDLSFKQLVLGTDNVGNIDGYLAHVMSSRGSTLLAGVGGWFVENGIIVFSAFVAATYLLGIRSSGLLIILLITSTVGLNTNQNFCILAYYVGYMLRHAEVVKFAPLLRFGSRYRAGVTYSHQHQVREFGCGIRLTKAPDADV